MGAGLTCRTRGAGLPTRLERLKQQDPRGWYWRVGLWDNAGEERVRIGTGLSGQPLTPQRDQPAADFTRPGMRSARRAMSARRKEASNVPRQARTASPVCLDDQGPSGKYVTTLGTWRGTPEAKQSQTNHHRRGTSPAAWKPSLSCHWPRRPAQLPEFGEHPAARPAGTMGSAGHSRPGNAHTHASFRRRTSFSARCAYLAVSVILPESHRWPPSEISSA